METTLEVIIETIQEAIHAKLVMNNTNLLENIESIIDSKLEIVKIELIKQMDVIMDAKLEIVTVNLIEKMDAMINAKLKAVLVPIITDIQYIKNDLHIVKIQVESINNRLCKLEDRMATIELKVDRTDRIVNQLKNAAA